MSSQFVLGTVSTLEGGCYDAMTNQAACNSTPFLNSKGEAEGKIVFVLTDCGAGVTLENSLQVPHVRITNSTSGYSQDDNRMMFFTLAQTSSAALSKGQLFDMPIDLQMHMLQLPGVSSFPENIRNRICRRGLLGICS